ncbi:hypothetical protein [Algoriphagus sp.]|uniref:hypothetical protein n=1 Tax=Algoriphagus sp. TaxID=1872435 RepID=UPI0026355AD3|nr:hypothetical protein [Algoriphagus sp.]
MPQFLWKLHGKEAYIWDLVLTYFFAGVLTAFQVVYLLDSAYWKTALMVFLSFDIGGGVVSNFTLGTRKFYAESRRSPHIFIWFHSIQSLGLILVYPECLIPILVISGASILSSSLIVLLRTPSFQMQWAGFFYGVLVLLSTSYFSLPIPVISLLLLLAFKLVVAFSGNFKRVTE